MSEMFLITKLFSSDGRPEKDSKLQSQSSSSQSISHSSDREDVKENCENTLQVPSIAQSRTMVRAASASEISQHHRLDIFAPSLF